MNSETDNEDQAPVDESASEKSPGWLRRHWMSMLTLLGCGLTLSFWLVIKQFGDKTTYGTVLLFGPRWLYVLPWMLSGCFLLKVGRFSQALFLITGWIALFHILMLNVPVRSLVVGEGETIKVLTCNLGDTKNNPEGLERLIHSERPDLVMLQETGKTREIRWPAGWTSHHVGGLLVASRFPMTFQTAETPTKNKRNRNALSRHTMVLFVNLQTAEHEICVASIHLPTPRRGLIEFLEDFEAAEEDQPSPVKGEANKESTSVLESEITERSNASGRVHDQVLIRGEVDIIAGDFNMLADSRIFRRDWSEFKNAFSYGGWGIGYTKYEKFEGHQVMGRIDHILVHPRHGVRRCWVGPHIGSDHRPLLAEIVLRDE